MSIKKSRIELDGHVLAPLCSIDDDICQLDPLNPFPLH
jgi:hypothetical protein